MMIDDITPITDPESIKRDAYRVVYEDILAHAPSMFMGRYDAINGNRHFMYGVETVMEYIAYNVSEHTADTFSNMFLDNMDLSEHELN